MKRSSTLLGLAFVLLLVSISFAFIPSIAEGAVPKLINFQGILKDGSGNPVTNGSYSVIFTIYDAAVGGSVQWAETTSVTTSTGLFTVLLGALNPVPDSAFNDSSRYLGVKVGADPEMGPRQKLVSVPFATGNWSTTGNGGTETSRNFLGTIDNQPLEVKVNGLRALRIEPTTSDTSPNLIAGHNFNSASAGVAGATINGGGFLNNNNRVTDNFGTIGGGANNSAGDFIGTIDDAAFATVGGGIGNRARGPRSTVPGGGGNFADGAYSFAAGRKAKANHAGTFVWADTGDAIFGTDFASTAPNQFLIRASGGVGIGTSSPGARLSLGISTANTILALYDEPGNQHGLGIQPGVFRLHMGNASDRFAFLSSAAGTELVTIQGIGRVGIGTASPEEGLHIGGTATQSRILLSNGGDLMWESTTGANTPVLTLHSDDNVYLDAQAAATSDLIFRTNTTFTERMRITDAGNVGIGTSAPSGRLQVNGALATVVNAVSANTTLTDAHSVVLVDAIGGPRTITLPTAVGINGRQYVIKKSDATANAVTIDANGAENIDGAFTYVLSSLNKYVVIVSNGTSWWIIGNN